MELNILVWPIWQCRLHLFSEIFVFDTENLSIAQLSHQTYNILNVRFFLLYVVDEFSDAFEMKHFLQWREIEIWTTKIHLFGKVTCSSLSTSLFFISICRYLFISLSLSVPRQKVRLLKEIMILPRMLIISPSQNRSKSQPSHLPSVHLIPHLNANFSPCEKKNFRQLCLKYCRFIFKCGT